MRITVDSERCSGHGRCYSLAPDVFTADAAGYCAQRGTTFEVDESAAAAATTAALNCPEAAIEIE